MTRSSAWKAKWKASAQRSLIYAVLVLFHGALLLCLLRPPAPLDDPHVLMASTRTDALLVQWTRTEDQSHRADVVAPSITRPHTIVANRVVTRHSVVSPHPIERDAPAVVAGPSVLAEPAPVAAPDTQSAGDYVSGGALLRHDQNPGVAANLPGSDRPMVHGIQLADPATQGIKPVVNWMQRHFGVPDKHCIDVDAWRMMTPQQLLDRHMSPDDVEKEAQRHRCFPRDA